VYSHGTSSAIGAVGGAPVAQKGGFVPGPHRDCVLAGALGPDGRQPPGPGDPQFRGEQRRLRSVPGLGPAERLRRFGDLTLVCQRGGQQRERERAPGVAGALEGGTGRSQQADGRGVVAAGDEYPGQQHLADRPARLGRLGEVGQPPRGLLGGVGLPRHQQHRDLGKDHREPQQAGVFGRQRPAGQRGHPGESAHPCRRQRRRGGGPGDRGVRRTRAVQHLSGDLHGAAHVAGVHREGGRQPVEGGPRIGGADPAAHGL